MPVSHLHDCACDLSHAEAFALFATTVSLCVTFFLQAVDEIGQTFLRIHLRIIARIVFQFQYWNSLFHRMSTDRLLIRDLKKHSFSVDCVQYRKYQLELMNETYALIKPQMELCASMSSLEGYTYGGITRLLALFFVVVWTILILYFYSINDLSTLLNIAGGCLNGWADVVVKRVLPCAPIFIVLFSYFGYILFKICYRPMYQGCYILSKMSAVSRSTHVNLDIKPCKEKKSYLWLYGYLICKKIRMTFRMSFKALAVYGVYLAVF